MNLCISDWHEDDTAQLLELFLQTVKQVNIQDYNEQQIAAWASDSLTLADWQARMRAIRPFVARDGELVVGYADLQPDGLIDHFFCHHAYQGQGVGRALMQHIQQRALAANMSRLYAHVSRTAKGFFQHWGFEVTAEQCVEIRGQILVNFLMEKPLT